MFGKLLRTISLLFIILTLYSCDSVESDDIIGSGNIIKVEYSFDNFDKLYVGNAFKVTVTKGLKHSINLRVDDNLTEYLKLSSSNGVLYIKLENNYNYSDVYLQADIEMPDLTDFELSGACSGTITGFDFSHNLKIDLSGASNLTSTIFTGNLDVNLSGASNATLVGDGLRLGLNLSGASNIEMRTFEVTKANVIISGASRATIFTNGRLDANVSGASSLRT